MVCLSQNSKKVLIYALLPLTKQSSDYLTLLKQGRMRSKLHEKCYSNCLGEYYLRQVLLPHRYCEIEMAGCIACHF